MYNKFINRQKEMATLEREYISEMSSFVVIYGRRRTGKTTLIKEFIKGKNALFFLGDTQTEYNQINSMKNTIAEYYNDNFIKNISIESWEALFEYLKSKLQDNTIFVIDEFQYLVKGNKAFPSIFNKFWESVFKEKKIMVIICGSLVGMMYETALSYNSPLYGRRTAQINLKPIDFYYYNEFFENSSVEKLIQLYSITGGIPKYIEHFKNYSDNIFSGIEERVIDKDSLLYAEPKFLLQEEVTDTSTYFTLLKIISEGENKIGNIAGKMNLNTNNLSPFLSKLIELDILEKEVPITEENPEKSKKGLYFIKDNFMNFWFKFIFPKMGYIESGNIEVVKKQIEEGFELYVSTVFEKICRNLMYRINFPVEVNRYGRWWEKNSEIDIVGIGEKELIFGECKWSNKKVGMNILEELIKKSEKIDSNSKKISYILFSKSGFTDDIIKAEEERKNLYLMDLEKMEKILTEK